MAGEEELGSCIPTVFQGNINTILLDAVRVWGDNKYRILDYPKQLTLDTVKEIMMVISDDKGLLQGYPSAAVPAKKYAISFADVARKVKNAAGAYIENTCLVNLA